MADPIKPLAAAPAMAPAGPKGRSLPLPASEDTKLKAACDDMEALFVHHMLTEMRKSVDKSGMMDGGRSEEIYTSMMDAELAREIARAGGLGLSKILQEQLRQRQALAPPGGLKK